MPFVRRSLAAGLALAASACAPVAAASLSAAAPAGPAVRAVSRADLIDLGRATAATPVHLALTLAYRNEAQLLQLVRLQGTPGSPLYHHFLTRAQFAAAFSPAPADYARAVASLRAAGFSVRTSPSRTLINADGTAPLAERYFTTELHRVAQTGVGIRYANVKPATLPAAIAPLVRNVFGLDDLVKFHSDRVPARPDAATFAPDAVTPQAATPPLERVVNGTFEGLYPEGIKKAYKFPALAGKNGLGHPIGIVIDSDIAEGNLATFWKGAGITRSGSIYRVAVDGGAAVGADVGETAIDTETSSSLAPASDIYVYLIPELSDTAIIDAYTTAVDQNAVDVVSSSFGGCELDDTPFASSTDAVAVQGESEGMTFTASSGDAGGYCEAETRAGKIFFESDIVEAPASNPHFVAVGGTTLKINAKTGARVSETAWSPGGKTGGGGGGVSSYWPIPTDYQAGVPGMAVVPTITATPPASQPASGFAGRNVPDVALDAANTGTSYIAVYDTPDGGWVGYGGTSVANPIYAAFVAEQNQLIGGYTGYVNPSLYAAWEADGYASLFFDVTSGSIGAGWSAAPGYDQATGIGSIKDGEVYQI
jgi:kumamolisin